VVGVSRGGELALLLGAHYPELTAVVSYVGSGYVHAEWNGPGTDVSVSAWTWRGEPVPHLNRPDMTERELREVEIPVERINGPVLLIGADADLVWPSSYLSNVAWARLQREGHDWPDQFLRYPGAGHGISRPPYQPVTSRYLRALGGDAHSNAIAMANAWPAVCHLLDTRLVFDG
jgi:pimeloyl-ACP methyl ester carboxylesterase